LDVTREDNVLVGLHRAASAAGRPGVCVPSRDLEEAGQAIGRPRAKEALSRLLRAGRVISVRQDLIVLPDATGRVTVDLPELIRVVSPSPYLITGGRALEEARLTGQHFFSVIVLVPGRVRGFSFRGEKAAFLPTERERIWGWREDGPHYATPERALVDALSHSRYGVPLSVALSALRKATQRDSDFLSRLVDATRRYGSSTTARRIGLVVEAQFGSDTAEPFRELIGSSRTPVLLRPGGPTDGEVDREWRVIVNATTQSEPATV
jgi:predicted transcriptional regulator of viral defense system